MSTTYIADQTFHGVDYLENKLSNREYEYCSFRNCNFSKAKIFESRFLESEFIDCNFSNAKLSQSSFQEVSFNNCKMLGLKFDECNQFNFTALFENCQLMHSSFYKMNLSRAKFIKCRLKGVDLTEANLQQVKIDACDLLNAIFDNTNLEKADLSSSFNYSIDPELNRVKGARFSYPGVIGLLDKHGIQVDSVE